MLLVNGNFLTGYCVVIWDHIYFAGIKRLNLYNKLY